MERTLSRLNARRATCTTIKILLSASSLALSGITRSSASVVFTRMSVKRAFAQVQNTFLSIGPLQNSLHLEQTILCDQNKREGRVDPALQFGARTIREATLPRQGADLIRLSCNGLADVGDRRERGRRWYVSIVSALDCRGRCAATSLNYSRGKDGARRRPPSAILNCEDRAKTKGNEDGEIRDFRVPSGSRKKKESKNYTFDLHVERNEHILAIEFEDSGRFRGKAFILVLPFHRGRVLGNFTGWLVACA